MAQINKPNEYFNTVLYTGNSSTQSITGVGFQPDWVWIKSRGAADNHNLFDSVRGANKYIYSNDSQAEVTDTNRLTSFDSDGFSLGDDEDVNENTDTLVAWNWLAANGTASNTDGSITSTVSVNTTSGFSIVSYTGDGNTNATVGHGLGVAPKMIITKNRSNVTPTNWTVYHASLSTNYQIALNQSDAQNLPSPLMVTTVGASTYTLGSSRREINESSNTYVAYCFAEKKGFSKFGSYTGNGSTDGTFVYTGFKPAYLMIKNRDLGAGFGFWCIWDNKRNTNNPENIYLVANAADADNSGDTGGVDFLSNGFKFRNSFDYSNKSATNYIYMAFAENPLVGTNNIPTTAR